MITLFAAAAFLVAVSGQAQEQEKKEKKKNHKREAARLAPSPSAPLQPIQIDPWPVLKYCVLCVSLRVWQSSFCFVFLRFALLFALCTFPSMTSMR